MEWDHQSSRDWSNLPLDDIYDQHATQWFLQKLVPVRPPSIVKCLHFGNLTRVLTGYIFRLPGIFINIVKFFLIYQSPTLTHNRRLSPFNWIFHPLRIGYQHTVRPVNLSFSFQDLSYRYTIKLIALWFFTTRQVKKVGATSTA